MAPTTTAKPNIYPGACATCSATVAAGAGTRHQVNGRWIVRHLPGQCVTAPAVVAPVASAAPARIAVEDAGVYVMADGSIVRVKATRDGARTYASRWVTIGGTRVTEAGTFENGDYEYVAGLVSRVAAEGRKMTAPEAAAFMVRYGRCVRCNRHLKAAQSVVQGIGPVCVNYFGGREAFAAALAGVTVAPVAGDLPTIEAAGWEGEQSSPFGGATWAQELAEADAEAQEAARVTAEAIDPDLAEARRVAAEAEAEIAQWGTLVGV